MRKINCTGVKGNACVRAACVTRFCKNCDKFAESVGKLEVSNCIPLAYLDILSIHIHIRIHIFDKNTF